MNVIIIDNHPLTRIAIRNLLDTSGITMTIGLDNGDQVVQAVEKTEPELLIIDVSIPGVSGIGVLEQLRKRHYAGVITIVSTKNEFSYGKRSTEYSVNGLVSKKEGMNSILAAVETAKNDYNYFPFSLEHFTDSPVNEQDKLDTLSSQEMRILCYILNGMDRNTVAGKVDISNKTVSTYKSRLMKKLDCSSLMEIYGYTQRNKTG